MKSPGHPVSAETRPGRNDPCPCGSGQKFKRCCGAAAPQTANAQTGKPSPAVAVRGVHQDGTRRQLDAALSTKAVAIGGRSGRSRQLHAGPLSAPFTGGGVSGRLGGFPPSRSKMMDAERQRQLGTRHLEAGQLGAAIAALRRATELDPGDAEAHHLLGRAFLRAGHLSEAVDSLRLAIVLNDDLAAAHLDLAIVLAAAGNNREALGAGRRAVGLAPQLAEGHRLLSELLEAAGNTGEAAGCSRRAAAVASDTTAGRLDLVRALTLEGNFEEAETRLRQALALDAHSDELHKALGEVLAKRGLFDAAIAECDRALRLNPLQVPAHYTAVRIRKCTEADRPRLRLMLSTLRDASINDVQRLFLHFAIGKLLDDLGEHREAMRHFDMGNSIRGRNIRFDRAGLVEVIDRLIGRFTSDFFAANRGFGLEDEIPVLIVGMPRSGTTLVEQIVSSHPAVAAGEEQFFWSNRANSRGIAEATALTPEAGRGLAAEYLALLRQIGPSAARVTDKQPFNFQQLGLIHLVLPNARFIHCRRHPVDVCLSMYFTFFKGRIPFVSNKADLVFAYQQYDRIMHHWRKVLPSDCFLEVDYERLVADREAITRQLIAFTGLDWHDACLQPERNERPVTTASFWQARQPIFTTSVERWRRYERWIGELKQLLL